MALEIVRPSKSPHGGTFTDRNAPALDKLEQEGEASNRLRQFEEMAFQG